ncbi:MAG: phenylacetate--CoA ligase, partial [Oscillospiraceae bacterium]
TKEGIPMLRYRTKDITRLDYDPCECGRTFVRMDKVKGRSDDMLKIRGVNIFPSQIESVILGIDKINPHYQLVITREGYRDNLEIKVELADSSLLEQYGALERLQHDIKDKVKVVLGIDTKISLVENKSLERFAGKAKRIIDLRNQK